MHPNNQDFLVVGTIEYTNLPALGKSARRAPEKVMLQLVSARLFEAENLAPLRIDPGHDVPDGAVLAGSVYPLKNQQQRIAVGCAVKLLQRTQPLDVFLQEFLTGLLRFTKGLHNRRPISEFDFFAGPHTEIL